MVSNSQREKCIGNYSLVVAYNLQSLVIWGEAPSSDWNIPLWEVQGASFSSLLTLASSPPPLDQVETFMAVDESEQTGYFKISLDCSFRVFQTRVVFKEDQKNDFLFEILIFPDALKIGHIGDQCKKLGTTSDFNQCTDSLCQIMEISVVPFKDRNLNNFQWLV